MKLDLAHRIKRFIIEKFISNLNLQFFLDVLLIMYNYIEVQ